MEAITLLLHSWVLGLLVLSNFTSSYPFYQTQTPTSGTTAQGSFVTYKYARGPEVERECESVLSSASELKIDDNRVYAIKNELAFINGDWKQQHGGVPLMPFDSGDVPKNISDLPDPLRLASFMVNDVDPFHRSRVAVNVSGVLTLGISRNGSSVQRGYSFSPQFQIWPGSSLLTILFEGVYTESETNGGERVMCLMGSAMLPSRQPDSTDPWKRPSGSGSGQPTLLQDKRILLILRYPKSFTLTSRAVHGEMRSLNQKSSHKYFDKVSLSSQLGAYSIYQFGSESIVSVACSPYPYQDHLVGDKVEIYKDSSFCEIIDRFTSGEIFTVVPNWNCNSTDEYCSKLGPFDSERKIKETDGGFQNVGLMIQDVRCESRINANNASSARVSAVFRAIPPWENQYTAAQRTGLSGMTLSVEGIWNSSSGQLCMVGCLGLADAGCDSRVCVYVPISFSIKQRNIIFGSISSIKNGTSLYYPLSFERAVHPSELWIKFSTSHLSYKYSKIKLAGAFLERSEPFDFGAVIKKSLLSYPAKEENGDELTNLSNLSDDLTLHVPALPDPSPTVHADRPFAQLEILSLGSLFGCYWSSHNISSVEGGTGDSSKSVATEWKLLLNVSAELTLTGNSYSNFSVLFLEGLYNPVDGKMYLYGCRDIRASWKILFESMDLEDGLDCLIEVKVEYPPTTARWLMNPTAKISIESQRTVDDPLHFSPVKLQTLPILYRVQREDILSRKGVEGILRIFTLSLAIACISSQLFYIRDNAGVIPYISVVMLGVQALGYSIPLIMGVEALFSRLTSESYETPSYDLEKNHWFQIVDYFVKILVLGAFLLTLRLGQKVYKSRIRLLTRTPLEPGRVPNDKRVLMASLGIHTVGFLIILIVNTVGAAHRPIQTERYLDSRGYSHKLREWGIELEEYVGMVQDFFLLPQIVGNFFWQINCKPLRKAYYIGITVVRFLPHVYDYIRAPVFNPYFSEEYQFVNPSLDFYSKFGDIAIPLTAIVLAICIYFQQKWNYQSLSQKIGSGRGKLLFMGSRVYERLPSMSFEAELVSGVNDNAKEDQLQKD